MLKITSLLSRYSILYSKESPVQIEKISFDGKTISAGLKANRPISTASAILSACGSMSENFLDEGMSVSAVEGPEKHFPWYWVPFDLQTKTANRTARFVHIPSFPLMLKAFRQFSWIKGSRAYVIWTLRDIGKGESITLRYRDEKEGSYFSDNSPCSCETCTGRSVKLTPRSPTVSGPARSGKRTRRSGAREKAKRKAKLAELELAEGFGGEPDGGM